MLRGLHTSNFKMRDCQSRYSVMIWGTYGGRKKLPTFVWRHIWTNPSNDKLLYDVICERTLQMTSFCMASFMDEPFKWNDKNVFFCSFLTVAEVPTVRVVAFERLIRKGWQVQKKKRPNLAMSSFKKVQSSKIKRPNFQRTFVKITKSILKS